MKTATRNLAILIAAAAGLAATTSAHAILVTGPWNNADPPGSQGNGPLANGGPGILTVGDGTSNSADGEMFDSPFPNITLTNTGDKIVLTGTMRMVGSINSVATSGTPRTQFRMGLFNGDELGLDDNGWTGYLMTNSHGNGSPNGSISRKPSGNTSVNLSTTGGNSLVSTPGNGTVFNDDTFTLTMTLEKVPTGLAVSGTITGTATTNFSESLSTTDVTPATFTFNHVGFLLGANIDVDQAFFTNLDIFSNTVPESPWGGVLTIAGILGAAWLKSRRISVLAADGAA